MQEQKDKVANRYVSFMGAWLSGAVVGHFVSKIIGYVFVIWLLNYMLCK